MENSANHVKNEKLSESAQSARSFKKPKILKGAD